MKSARQYPPLSRVVEAFADALRENPDFVPPSQSGRVRCDVCGAYHPGEACGRCCALLQDAHVLAQARLKEHAQDELRAALRQKHAARRAAPGFTRARGRSRSRRTLKRDIAHARAWLRARFSSVGLLTFAGVWVLLVGCGVAVPQARGGLRVAALFYGALLFLLIATKPHALLQTRSASYRRWHTSARGWNRSTLWHALALALCVSASGVALTRAQRAISTPPIRAQKPRIAFWTTTGDWNKWTSAGIEANFERGALSLRARKKARVVDVAPFGQFQWSPRSIAIAPDERYAYVTGAGGNSNLIVPLHTSFQERRGGRLIPLTSRARDVAVAPDGTFILGVGEGDNSVTRVPVESLRTRGASDFSMEETRIEVGAAPLSVAIAPDSSFAMVCNRGDNTISRVSMKTNRVVATVRLGGAARSVVFAPRGEFALIANMGANRLMRMDTRDNTISATLSDAGVPWDVAISRHGDFALVALRNTPELLRVRTRDLRVVARISLPAPARNVQIAPDDSYAFAPSDKQPAVYCVRLNNNSLAATLRTRGMPREIAIAPSGRFALLCSGTDVARIEGGVPEYAMRGTAQTTLDLQTLPPVKAATARTTTLHLSKHDALNKGALVYYAALNRSRTFAPLPTASHASSLAAWQSHGWTRLVWNGSYAQVSASPNDRYLHLAIFMQRSAPDQLPQVRALSVSREQN